MIIKLIGAGLILLGCGALGVLIIASHKREERFLLDLIRILECMECELTQCMKTVISKNKELSNFLVQALNMLGSTLGRFDLEGQIKGLRSTHIECNRFLEQLSEKKNVHLRNCQTIWLCAGAALVIIFI